MIIKLYEIIKFQVTSFYSNLMKSARTKSSENKMNLEKNELEWATIVEHQLQLNYTFRSHFLYSLKPA